jgi:superoxide reductase
MAQLSELIKTADWKSEKHVPVIECPDTVKAGEVFEVKTTLGKEVAHPNTTEHHISWITLYYQEDGGKFARQAAHVAFDAHGEDAAGANEGPIYTHHEAITNLKISKSGTLYAEAYCNIHGLWQSQKAISVK